jgi:hypothetical protein
MTGIVGPPDKADVHGTGDLHPRGRDVRTTAR